MEKMPKIVLPISLQFNLTSQSIETYMEKSNLLVCILILLMPTDCDVKQKSEPWWVLLTQSEVSFFHLSEWLQVQLLSQSQKLTSVVQVFNKSVEAGFFWKLDKRILHCTFIRDFRVHIQYRTPNKSLMRY